GSAIHVHVVTTPLCPTSTNSPVVAFPLSSYSCGGTSTLPSAARTPKIRRSSSPPRNRPITGPTLRVYVYSTVCAAVSATTSGASVSAITTPSPPQRHRLPATRLRPSRRTTAPRCRTETCRARPPADRAPALPSRS